MGTFGFLWSRLCLDTLWLWQRGLMQAASLSDVSELRRLWLSELGRIAAEHMRSPAFLESMARGLSIMTGATRVASRLPYFVGARR